MFACHVRFCLLQSTAVTKDLRRTTANGSPSNRAELEKRLIIESFSLFYESDQELGQQNDSFMDRIEPDLKWTARSSNNHFHFREIERKANKDLGHFITSFWCLTDVLHRLELYEKCITKMDYCSEQSFCMFAGDLRSFKWDSISVCVWQVRWAGVKCRLSARSARGNVMSQRAWVCAHTIARRANKDLGSQT